MKINKKAINIIVMLLVIFGGYSVINSMNKTIKELKNINIDLSNKIEKYNNYDLVKHDTLEVVKSLNATSEKDGIYLDDGEFYHEFNDGSYCIINENTDTYIFQPVELLDYDYKVNNLEQLKNIITSYKNYKYDYFKK